MMRSLSWLAAMSLLLLEAQTALADVLPSSGEYLVGQPDNFTVVSCATAITLAVVAVGFLIASSYNR